MKSRILLLILVASLLACEESLPTRQEPQNPLAITNVIYAQGMYSTGPFMEFLFLITNNYEETFQAEVTVTGHVTVWWKKRPDTRITLDLGNQHFVEPSKINGKILTIDPGSFCTLKIYWYLQLENGASLLDLLDYSDSVPSGGLIKSKPETFVMEAGIKLFDQTGYLQSKPLTFTFVGYKQAANPDRISTALPH